MRKIRGKYKTENMWEYTHSIWVIPGNYLLMSQILARSWERTSHWMNDSIDDIKAEQGIYGRNRPRVKSGLKCTWLSINYITMIHRLWTIKYTWVPIPPECPISSVFPWFIDYGFDPWTFSARRNPTAPSEYMTFFYKICFALSYWI